MKKPNKIHMVSLIDVIDKAVVGVLCLDDA